jgi:predicted transcriptional regulator
MGRKAKHFQRADEKFIKDNCDCLTVSEIARRRKIPYSHVYNYMTRKGLTMLTERAKRQKCQKKKKGGGKYFNPDNNKNWIL